MMPCALTFFRGLRHRFRNINATRLDFSPQYAGKAGRLRVVQPALPADNRTRPPAVAAVAIRYNLSLSSRQGPVLQEFKLRCFGRLPSSHQIIAIRSEIGIRAVAHRRTTAAQLAEASCFPPETFPVNIFSSI
jgi:hypothetical protein